MEGDDHDHGCFSFGTVSAHSPSLVSLAAFSAIPSPSPRRLSSHFTRPSRPVSEVRKLAWVSLEGRLVNAEEASSAKAIKGGLSREEAAAWEMFTPIHRFLIVAVIGVAVAESKKNRVISQLKKSVELRDQVLLSMQQKLDSLCERLYYAQDQKEIEANMSLKGKEESAFGETFGDDKINFVECGCWLCDQHHHLFNGLMGNSAVKDSSGHENEMMQYKVTPVNEVEPEERRMSDLSDWASSITSSAEVQTNNFTMEQDISNLRMECEEKDATIRELTAFLQSSNTNGSKRISELEDIIRRKNMIITRLRKDMVVLEQKVVQLTRLQRPSTSSASNSRQFPAMADNLLYDMDSTTSPSSSDSDSPPVNRPEVPVPKVLGTPILKGDSASTSKQKSAPPKFSSLSVKPTELHTISHPSSPLTEVKPTEFHTISHPSSPLTEISTNQNSNTLSSSRQKQPSARGDFKKTRRRPQTASKDAAPQKRWI
ncbi:uncharacterized protein LOC116143816 [Pistacia vera]|uniref:uncharacterized protein LOC116143816 n=1 Tax=Pistacia vera TaxID=55513 RepID=UPI001263547E|nr:uncharacterized protein LOC116143816 [Pistacia vera]